MKLIESFIIRSFQAPFRLWIDALIISFFILD